MKNTFQLKRPIIVPSPSVKNAFLIFPYQTCALSYDVVPLPKEDAMSVTLSLVDKVNGTNIFPLGNYKITEQGFPTGVVLNQTEIDNYKKALAPLLVEYNSIQVLVFSKQSDIAIAIAQKLPTETLEAELSLLLENLNNVSVQISDLGEEPEKQYEYRNKYSEIIQYFDNSGTITQEGIAWAKTIPFLGLTIGDFIV